MHDEYKDQSDLPKVIREKNAEGVLFMNAVSPALVRELHDRQVKVVAVDCHPRLADLDTVYVDTEGVARAACRHLLGLGHQTSVMLPALSDAPSLEDRRRGFPGPLREAGIEVKESLCVVEGAQFAFTAGYKKSLELYK